jgi:hypothetical protein
MMMIYSHARELFAFLGEEADNSEDIPLLIARITMSIEKWEAVEPVYTTDLTDNIKPRLF